MNRLLAVIFVALFLAGCASQRPFVQDVSDPEEEVVRLIELELEAVRSGQYCRRDSQSEFSGCDGVLQRLTQLSAVYPDFERLQMALAIAHHARQRNREAQFYLDQLLATDRPRPEAAILGARLALEEGNHNKARSLLESQIRLNPAHAGLREALAAVFYLEHKPADGFGAIALAERLGAPGWRVAYHRGLLFELTKNEPAACEQYAKSVALKPDFVLPEGRLFGLVHNPVCVELAHFLGGV
jgi:tetratricopeptide (TPR) repeat protein